MKGVYFVSGIDTDIGKTVATGMLAKQLLQQGKSVISKSPCKPVAKTSPTTSPSTATLWAYPCRMPTNKG